MSLFRVAIAYTRFEMELSWNTDMNRVIEPERPHWEVPNALMSVDQSNGVEVIRLRGLKRRHSQLMETNAKPTNVRPNNCIPKNSERVSFSNALELLEDGGPKVDTVVQIIDSEDEEDATNLPISKGVEPTDVADVKQDHTTDNEFDGDSKENTIIGTANDGASTLTIKDVRSIKKIPVIRRIVRKSTLTTHQKVAELRNKVTKQNAIANQFKCRLCAYSCDNKTKLTLHMAVHKPNQSDRSRASESTYHCLGCLRKFVKKDDMDVHRKLCPKYQYKCLVCNRFACYGKTDFDRHMRKHNGEKPFQCEMCKKCYTRKENLDNHVTKAHGQSKD